MLTSLLSLWMMTCYCQDSLFPKKIHIDSSGYVMGWPWNIKPATDTFIVDLPWHLKYNNDHYVIGLAQCAELTAAQSKAITSATTSLNDARDVINTQAGTIADYQKLDDKNHARHVTDSLEIKKQINKNAWTTVGGGLGWLAAILLLILSHK